MKNTISLSPREIECWVYIAKGHTYKSAAKNLGLSPRTVESYLTNLKFKTGCQTRLELVKYFWDNNFEQKLFSTDTLGSQH